MAKAVVFDFDGVIVDSEPLHYRTFCQTLKPLGIRIGWSRWYKDFAGTGSRKIIAKLFEEFGIQEDVSVWVERRKALFASYAKQGKLRPRRGLRMFLSKLRTRNIKTAIASGGHTMHIKTLLSLMKLNGMFNAIVGGDSVKNGKPDPEIFLLAAKKLGVKPEECIAIEDSPAGCDAVRRAGMPLICFNSPARKSLNVSCIKTIDSYSEFPLELLDVFHDQA